MADENTTSEATKATEAPAAQSNETKTQQTTPQPSPDVTAFKALMDKERTLRQREQALSQKERELSQYANLPQLAKERPLDALRTLGVEYEDLVKRVSKGERPDPVDPIKREMEELRQQLQTLKQREEEAERTTATQRAQSAVREFVSSSADFPLTKELDAADMVFDLVQSKYNAGESISEADAAREVEAYLSGLVEKALKVDAVRSKFLGQQTTKPETPHISNQDVSVIAGREAPGDLSEQDRIAMAIKVMEQKMRERTQ